jgi:large subunit ribosomal protein L21
VELDRVLLVNNEGLVTVGTPVIPGAKVLAEVAAQGRGKKIIVFKFHHKTRYRRKTGHRQSYTALKVKEIVTG